MLIMDFSNNEAIQVKLSIHIISILKLYNNMETINYKSKNPQVNLMGSNPTPRAYLGGLYKIIKNKENCCILSLKTNN